MDGATRIADSISANLKKRLPRQRKTQREKLALLVAAMLDVRSANLMDLAAGLPRAADRTDMRYQWITRLLGNPLVISDEVMEPFAREVLERATAEGRSIVLRGAPIPAGTRDGQSACQAGPRRLWTKHAPIDGAWASRDSHCDHPSFSWRGFLPRSQ